MLMHEQCAAVERFLRRMRVALTRELLDNVPIARKQINVVLRDARFSKIQHGVWTLTSLANRGRPIHHEEIVDAFRRVVAVRLATCGPHTVTRLAMVLKVARHMIEQALDDDQFCLTSDGRKWRMTDDALGDREWGLVTEEDDEDLYLPSTIRARLNTEESFAQSNAPPPSIDPLTLAARTMMFLAENGTTRYGFIARELGCRLDELIVVLESDERFCRSQALAAGWYLEGTEDVVKVDRTINRPAPVTPAASSPDEADEFDDDDWE